MTAYAEPRYGDVLVGYSSMYRCWAVWIFDRESIGTWATRDEALVVARHQADTRGVHLVELPDGSA